MKQYPHYFKDVSHLDHIDVYRVLFLYGVIEAPIAHAAKKLLVSGGRGAKDMVADVTEARDALNRWLDMLEEDSVNG